MTTGTKQQLWRQCVWGSIYWLVCHKGSSRLCEFVRYLQECAAIGRCQAVVRLEMCHRCRPSDVHQMSIGCPYQGPKELSVGSGTLSGSSLICRTVLFTGSNCCSFPFEWIEAGRKARWFGTHLPRDGRLSLERHIHSGIEWEVELKVFTIHMRWMPISKRCECLVTLCRFLLFFYPENVTLEPRWIVTFSQLHLSLDTSGLRWRKWKWLLLLGCSSGSIARETLIAQHLAHVGTVFRNCQCFHVFPEVACTF